VFKATFILAAASVLFVSACGSGAASSDLIAQVNELRAKNDTLQEQLSKLASRVETAETQRSLESIVALLPADTGYSTMRVDVGVLVVSIEDIQPYASGSRVKLRFGNPTTGRTQGLRLKLEWGGTGDIKAKDHTLSEILMPGSWATVSLPLEDVPPKEFSGLRLRYIGHQGIFLNGR
jgi:outer membrane murein-binding lipoprotein Lpp